jgi:hypothetical protein
MTKLNVRMSVFPQLFLDLKGNMKGFDKITLKSSRLYEKHKDLKQKTNEVGV